MAAGDRGEVALRVERMVAGGDGLARAADGRVVFVRGGLPGELVRVRTVAVKRDFAKADVVDVIDPSPLRRMPPCPTWHRGCGGCDWQHIDPQGQLALKLDIVRDALRRGARLPDARVIAGGSVGPEAYRTSMRFGLSADGRPSLRRRASNDLVANESCIIAHPLLREMAETLRFPGAEEVSMRVSAATGERTAWWTPDPGIEVDRTIGTGESATIAEHVDGVQLRVSASAFFQSGPQAAALLARTVRESGGEVLSSARVVVDAYGGVGLFAATAVPPAASVTLVESSPAACRDARHNLSGRSALVVESTVESWTPAPADVVIADPSRQGLGAPAAAVTAATGAPVVLLVSCDAASLGRDAALLGSHGYRHRATVVLDAFVHSHHVEAVTRFELGGVDAGGG